MSIHLHELLFIDMAIVLFQYLLERLYPIAAQIQVLFHVVYLFFAQPLHLYLNLYQYKISSIAKSLKSLSINFTQFLIKQFTDFLINCYRFQQRYNHSQKSVRMGACLKSSKYKFKQQQDESCNLSQVQFSHPMQSTLGVKIIKNPITGQFQGVPQQWAKRLNQSLQIDFKKVVPTQHLPQQIRPEKDMPQAIIDLINSQPVMLSSILECDQQEPTKETQAVKYHMNVDLKQRYGIKNLPKKWEKQFFQSSILPEDVLSDPKAMIDLITSYNQNIHQSKLAKKILTTQQFESIVQQIEFITDVPSKKYQFQDELGKGSFCKVYKATSRDDPQAVYAARIFKVSHLKIPIQIRNQIAVMKLCESKNIVKYYFTYYFNQTIFMFIQYADAGSLTRLIRYMAKINIKIDQTLISYIVNEILKGLLIIHSKSQIHRDIKSDNILLNKQGNIKIADFGHALQLTKQICSTTQAVGTPAWMAPQLIMKQDYTEKVDIWSLGILILQLCNGQPPYLRQNHLKTVYYVYSKPAPRLNQTFSFQIRNFVERCLQKNPDDRFSAKELRQHPFLKNFNQKDTKNKLKVLIKEMTTQ